MMTINSISWVSEFSCKASECSDNCCRGWIIPLDSNDIDRFSREHGLDRLKLYLATAGWKERFNQNAGRCPYLKMNGFCGLQVTKGHDFIPWACQNYPRFYRNYGEFEEISLDLSCVEATRLLLSHIGDTKTITSDGESHTNPCTTNDDTEFLSFLVRIRAEMIAITQEYFSDIYKTSDKKRVDMCRGFADKFIFFANDIQRRILDGDIVYDDISFEKYFRDEAWDESKSNKSSEVFPASLSMISSILNTSLYQSGLHKNNPTLYESLERVFDMTMRFNGAEDRWLEFIEDKLSKHPEILPLLGEYFSYYLYQYFLRTYETYGLRIQIVLGLCHTGMILLLAMTLTDKEWASGTEYLADIISAYNRRAYFNDSVKKDYFRILG